MLRGMIQRKVTGSPVRMSNMVMTPIRRGGSGRWRGQFGKDLLLRLNQVVHYLGVVRVQGKRNQIGVVVVAIVVVERRSFAGLRKVFGRFAAVSGSVRVVRRQGVGVELLLLALPGGHLGAQGVADLVAGGHGGNLLPHTFFVLEEATARLVNDGHHTLGHGHLFLFGSGNVVLVGKVFQDVLKPSVSGVAGAHPGLSAENVLVGGTGNLVGNSAVAALFGVGSLLRCYPHGTSFLLLFELL